MKKFNSLREYILTLKPSLIEELYDHPAACVAIFRDLPDLAKHFVLRLLFIELPISQTVVGTWVNKQAYKDSDDAVKLLKDLKIWSENAMPGGLPGWILNEKFRTGVRCSLMGGGDMWTVQPVLVKDKHCKDVAQLDSYSTERWETVLHYMVGSKQSDDPREKVGADTISTLKDSGLIKFDPPSSTPMITADGFQFLLLDTSSQVWYFMIKYLETIDSKGLSLIDCLSFLLQLSFATISQCYSSENLSENLLKFLQHLREFGLVYQRKRKDGRFYPTRLAVNLFSGLRETSKDVSKPGFVIVETNYRVYCYTDSQLQIALVGLFTELQYRFPGFTLGLLTRESVRQALKSGIKADEIIRFLTINAHPTSLKSAHPVPPTICDQIKYWEMERDRFVFTSGVLYSNFESQKDFEVLRNYARDSGHLIWETTTGKRTVVVSDEGHDDVRLFWKRHRKQSKDK